MRTAGVVTGKSFAKDCAASSALPGPGWATLVAMNRPSARESMSTPHASATASTSEFNEASAPQSPLCPSPTTAQSAGNMNAFIFVPCRKSRSDSASRSSLRSQSAVACAAALIAPGFASCFTVTALWSRSVLP